MPVRRVFFAALVSLGLAGCGMINSAQTDSDVTQIRFKDDAAANASPGDAILNLQFVDQSGKTIRPRDFVGKHNLVLVFVKGYNGSICPYCSAYTSGLISNFHEYSAGIPTFCWFIPSPSRTNRSGWTSF